MSEESLPQPLPASPAGGQMEGRKNQHTLVIAFIKISLIEKTIKISSR